MLGPSFKPQPAAELREKLMLAACRKVGHVDFGRLDFIEPLDLMLNDLMHESHLNALGQLVAPYYIKQILSMRLRVQQACATQQQATATAPIFILGLPRTGSSILHELLATHPDLRAPSFWESHHWPGSRFKNLATQNLTRAQVAVVDLFAPNFRRVHALAAMAPHECVSIQGYSLRSMQFHVAFRLPKYNRWMTDDCNWQPAYAWHHKYLSLLPPSKKRWVLKAPGHMLGLPALLKRYPDATFIQTHRHPAEVIPSMASLTQSLRGLASNFEDSTEIGRDVNELWRSGIQRVMAARASDSELNARFIDVKYRALLDQPQQTLERITAFCNITTNKEIRDHQSAHLLNNPKHRHGKHTYTPERYGLTHQQLNQNYADYIKQYL